MPKTKKITYPSLLTLKAILMLFIVNCSLLIVNCFSQSITWQKVLNNNYGWINKIQQTSEGGYIAVGTERINNEPKIYLVKLDYLGNVSWTKIIGVGNTDGFWVEETSDRGFIIGGDIDSGLVDDKVYLVKTDSLGNIQWHKTYANSDLDQCYCVKQTPDGGYILACRTTPYYNGAWYIKTDSLGNLQFQRVYNINNYETFVREIEIVNNGYITVGEVGIIDARDIYVMRLNNQLDTIWTKETGGNKADWGESIDKIENEGYIIGGQSFSFNPNNKSESYVCKLDSNGNVMWQRTYSGVGAEGSNSIRYKPNIGYVLAGISDSLGDFSYKAKIRLLDLNGNPLYENSFLPSNDYATFNSVELTNDNGFISGGSVAYQSNLIRMYILKTDSLLHSNQIGIINVNNEVPNKCKLFQNYPNPFNPVTKIRFELIKLTKVKLSLYDVNGREIEILVNSNLTAGTYEVIFNSKNLSSGIYFYRIFSNEYTATKKMILIK